MARDFDFFFFNLLYFHKQMLWMVPALQASQTKVIEPSPTQSQVWESLY